MKKFKFKREDPNQHSKI